MAILAVTQKVDIDDDNLGFFHQWLAQLARKDNIVVIANFVGKHNLPGNVKIFSLGKEKGKGFLVRLWRYQYLLLKILPDVDGIFFHMCPEYVIGAGLWPRMFGKKSLFWYTHKQVDWKLRLAEKLVNKIFTASAKSFRLASSKVEATGHGIDFKKFANRPKLNSAQAYRIISAGRIAPIKNYELLIEAAEILKNRNFDFKIEIAGAPRLEKDKEYFKRLKDLVFKKGLTSKIFFIGPVPYSEINNFYWRGDLFVNFSRTGSLDKAVLEAIASGCSALTTNSAFGDVLPEKYFCQESGKEVADKIMMLPGDSFDESLRERIIASNDLDNLSGRIIDFLKNER